MKAICPKDESHKRFVTVIHITQDVSVDEHGNFLAVVTPCLEMTHGPNAGNIWECGVCGAEAEVTER